MAINIVHIGTFLIKYMLIQFIENIKNYNVQRKNSNCK